MRESQMTVRGCWPGHWTCSSSRPVDEGHDRGALQLPAPAFCSCSGPSVREAYDSGAQQLLSAACSLHMHQAP